MFLNIFSTPRSLSPVSIMASRGKIYGIVAFYLIKHPFCFHSSLIPMFAPPIQETQNRTEILISELITSWKRSMESFFFKTSLFVQLVENYIILWSKSFTQNFAPRKTQKSRQTESNWHKRPFLSNKCRKFSSKGWYKENLHSSWSNTPQHYWLSMTFRNSDNRQSHHHWVVPCEKVSQNVDPSEKRFFVTNYQ